MKTSRKIKKLREDPTLKQARSIGVPEAQLIRGHFQLCDIANYSEADQRKMVRSKERQTVRRTPLLTELFHRKIIDQRQLKACEWYHDAHAMRYDTTGITAAYGESSRAGCTNFDHLPKTAEQECAFRNFEWAREGIDPIVRAVFERVVLQAFPIGRLGFMFHLALNQLMSRIEERVEL